MFVHQCFQSVAVTEASYGSVSSVLQNSKRTKLSQCHRRVIRSMLCVVSDYDFRRSRPQYFVGHMLR